MQRITAFRGKYYFLSNFYPCEVIIDNLGPYLTAEHAYQASKTLNIEEKRRILAIPSPNEAKRYGRRVTLRPDWDKVKLSVMETVVTSKFVNNLHLANLLISTGDMVLVEGNWWGDVYWGEFNGLGENHLGKILMRVRSMIRNTLRDADALLPSKHEVYHNP